jgi:transcription initiation factor TFIIIB Brf1 subunit/transcription initiation factor TFIIB
MNVPRSMKEIANITSLPTSVLNKTNKLFLKTMCDVIISSNQQEETALETTESRHLVHRYCNHLQLEKADELKLIRTVTKIDDDIKESGLLDCKTPSAVVTGIIMYACDHLDLEISKYTISTEFDISVVTINKITKIISNFYNTQ